MPGLTDFFSSRRKRGTGPDISGAPIRVAIIGAGKFAARTYYPLLSSMKGVTLAAAAARSETRLVPLAKKFRIAATHTDIDAMLSAERPEAVFAILPAASVLTVARLVLTRGIPLFLEKPPGLSSVETAELAALASQRGVATAVGFNRRYTAVIAESKRRVVAAGGIQSAVAEFHKDKPAGGSGDDLVTDIVHMIDLLRDLCGEPLDLVSTSGARSASGSSSPAYHAILRFESGAVGTLLAFRTGGARRERVEIHGTGISAEIDPPDSARIFVAGTEKPEVVTARSLVGSDDLFETYGYAAEARAFLESVRGGGRAPTTIEDSLKTMQLVERIRENARAETLGALPSASGAAIARAARQIESSAHDITGGEAAGLNEFTAVRAEVPEARAVEAVASAGRPRVALLLSDEIGRLIFPETVRSELSAFAEILQAEDGLSRKRAARLLEEADGVITSWKSPRLTAEMALTSRRLKIIAHAAGSVKNFVDRAFFERGVLVTNVASAIAPSVGEMALTLTLAGLRSLTRYDREMRRGDYRKNSPGAPPDSRGLFGKIVGLVGFGRTAREFVRVLAPFGCEIIAYDPFSQPAVLAALGVRRSSLEEVLRTSDIVSMHTAYTPETHQILNAERLGWLKNGCLVVNTARGSLIDETALANQLRSGRISAALDVTVLEPLPSGAEISSLPNVILTPHTSGPTYERLPELGRTAVEDLRLYFSGSQPRNRITVEMLATMA